MTRVLVGKLQLVQFKDLTKTKAIVEEIDGLLSDIDGVGKVHGHYYLLATELHKTEGDHANYYRYTFFENTHNSKIVDLKKLTIKKSDFSVEIFHVKCRYINSSKR